MQTYWGWVLRDEKQPCSCQPSVSGRIMKEAAGVFSIDVDPRALHGMVNYVGEQVHVSFRVAVGESSKFGAKSIGVGSKNGIFGVYSNIGQNLGWRNSLL